MRDLLPAGLTAAAAALLWALLAGQGGLYVFYAASPLADGAALAGLGLMLAALGLVARRPAPALQPGNRRRLALLAGWGGLVLVTAAVVLDRFVNSADEYAYLFQSLTYAAGRLWNPAPPLGQALAADYTWVSGDKWVGQYPPGWPAMLTAAQTLGLPPWSVGALLGAASVALVFHLQRREGAGPAAFPATLLYALAPFTVFNAASLHSHMPAALLALVAVLVALRIDKSPRPALWALLLGAVLGALGLVRYLTAALVALPIGLSLLRLGLRRAVPLGLLVGLGALPFAALLLGYHAAITGDPLRPVYYFGGRTVDHLYFDAAGIALALRISVGRVVELMLWTMPLVPLLAVAVPAIKARAGTFRAYDAVFPLSVLLFCFYPFDGANRYGPRYWFEAWPLLVVGIGTAVGGLAEGRVRRLGLHALWLGAAVAAAALPFVAWRYHGIVVERQEVARLVAAQGLSQAVVLVKADPGTQFRMEGDDLARNGLAAEGPVLYARADRTTAAALKAAFPERRVWVYWREPDAAHGRLDPVP